MKKLCIGTSGFVYRDWRGLFYPKKLPQRLWLSYYAGHFQTVEINNTFYTQVREETYERWYQETPHDFIFAIKGNRFITQYKRLIDIDDSLQRFFTPALALKEKFGVVLWQFPASFKIVTSKKEEYLERLATFLKKLPKSVPHAFEFRHTSWFDESVGTLLKTHNACMVIADSSRFPNTDMITADWIYVRFHGPKGLYTSSYVDEQLQEWATRITQWKKTKTVFCYFNNDYFGNAIQNAKTLQALVPR